jgi:hypothetical protein
MRDPVKISVFFFLLAIFILFSSCIKEEFDPKKLDTEFVINPVVAAPLGYIHYELDELLEDTSRSWKMMVDKDSLVSLIYEAEVLSQKASDFLQFSEIVQYGNIRNNTSKELDFKFMRFPDINPIQTDTVYFVLAGSGLPVYTEIDSIRVESMSITVSQSSQYDNLEGKMIITSPNIRKKYKGRWENWSMAINNLNGPPQLNITGNCVVIPERDSTGNNVIRLVFDLRPYYCDVVISPGDPILAYSVIINNLDYSAVYGYLGKMNFRTIPQDILIDIYNTLEEGTFNFFQPQLKLFFENSFGMPIQIITTDLYATTSSGISYDIEGSGLPSAENVQIIDYPSLKDFGKFAYDSITIIDDNTNISEVLDTASPSSITFGIEAITNPLEITHDNFITDKSQLYVKAKLILPVFGHTSLLVIEDSIKFEFDDFFQNPPEEIKRLALRLNFINGFPVDINTQIYFLDENHARVDSVFEERHIIKAGKDNNGDGVVEPFKNDPVEVEVTRTRINDLAETRYIFINGRLNTVNPEIPENFKFYSYYFLDAYIGVVGDLELNSTGY